MTKIAAILARVSRRTQEIESQVSSLVIEAEKFGYTVPENYIFSEKITGMDKTDSAERKSLSALKEAIKNDPKIECVFMWELTRLSRNPYFLVDQLKEFNNLKMPIYFYDSKRWTINIDTKTINHDTTTYIFGAATYGQNELDKIKERTKRGRDLKARKGLFVGHVSDGYTVELRGNEKHIIIDKERAPIIKSIFDMYTDKRYSTNRISSFLNENGIKPYNAYEAEKKSGNTNFNQEYKLRGVDIKLKKSSQKWTGSTIGQVLKNKWYIGIRSYNGLTYDVPPIIEKEQFEKAELFLSQNRTLPKNRKSIYLLSGLLFCGKCGSKMIGHKVRINSSYYCSSLETGKKCGLEGIAKRNIEAIVWGLTISNASQNPFIEPKNKNNIFNYFMISDSDIEIYKKQINENKDSISKKEYIISENKKALSIHYSDKARTGNKHEIEALSGLISKCIETIEANEKAIDFLNSENDTLITKIDTNKDLENVFEKMTSIQDLPTIKEILYKVVNRITLYNLSCNDKLIEVEYISGQKTAALYNSRNLKGHYITLSGFYKNESHITFNAEKLNFNNSVQYIVCSHNRSITVYISKEKQDEDIEKELERTINDFEGKCDVYENATELSSLDIRNIYQNHKIEYTILEKEPTDDEYKKWKEDYKKWSKSRNERKRENRNKR